MVRGTLTAQYIQKFLERTSVSPSEFDDFALVPACQSNIDELNSVLLVDNPVSYIYSSCYDQDDLYVQLRRSEARREW